MVTVPETGKPGIAPRERKKLGEILVEQQILTPYIVDRVLNISKASHQRFGEALLDMELITGEELANALALQYGYKVLLNFSRFSFPPEVLETVPVEVAFEHRIFPLKLQNGALALAMWDPTNEKIIRNLSANLGKRVIPYIAPKAEIMEALRRHYLGKNAERRRKLVLVVEDDQLCRTLMVNILSRDGCEVLEAPDGMEAFRMTLAFQPDVIVTDKEMPKLDGHAFLKSLQGMHDTKHIPVVLVSGRMTAEEEENAFDRGFFDYVTKPITPVTFLTRVRRALAAGRHGTGGNPMEMEKL